MSPDNIVTLRETLFSRRVDLNYILVRLFRFKWDLAFDSIFPALPQNQEIYISVPSGGIQGCQ